MTTVQTWVQDYIARQHAALNSIPAASLERVIEALRQAWRDDRRIFAIGNGGNAANASHFVTDLGKSASDKLGKRFRVLSLTDNVPWITAIGNDYSYDDVFVRQMENYATAGDLLIGSSVSGNSPNLVKAFEWAKTQRLHSIAFVGGKRGRMAELADQVIVVEDTHYGRVEDVQMHLYHMACYAFIEGIV